MNILNKINQAKLVGRGGACFPTGKKLEMVKKAQGKIKYVVCNGAEGEPGILKDGYILENFSTEVFKGMCLAMDFIKTKKAYLYLNYKYYKKFGKKLQKEIDKIKNFDIEIFQKPIHAGYIAGEESAMLKTIEKKRIEPTLKPPFPTTNGLFNCPTLINNVETFYNISLVADDKYENKRFYTINGDCLNTGVYFLPDSWSIKKILQETKNYQNDFSFFVQIGGDASGSIYSNKELNKKVDGAGSITVYSEKKHKSKDLIKKWLKFFLKSSCGQCTPCREGLYRLTEIIDSKKPDWKLFDDLLNNLDETSFCGLGCAVSTPIKTYFKSVGIAKK